MQDPRFWGWCVCVCVFVCFSMMQRELFVFSLWILIYRFQSCFISLWSQVAMGLQRVRESRGFQSGLGEKEDWSRLFRLYHFQTRHVFKTHVPASITQQGDDPGVFDQSCHQASLTAQLVRNLSAIQETGFDPWVGKIPWRREWLPTPVFWPGEFHGVAKSRTRLSDFHVIVTITNCPGIFL